MSLSTREQLWAFLALIGAILLLGLAPLVVSGLMGRTLPDSLIAVSDKTVTGLVGVLGTIAALVFRTNKTDETKADNTGKMADAVIAAANAGTMADPSALKPGDTVTLDKPDDPDGKAAGL